MHNFELSNTFVYYSEKSSVWKVSLLHQNKANALQNIVKKWFL